MILLIVYRSPVLPFAVLLTSLFAPRRRPALVVYSAGQERRDQLNGQSQGILSILVVGAATDYACSWSSRYREELRRPRRPATRRCGVAWRADVEPIAASRRAPSSSACSACCSSELRSTQGLGPVGAIGIAGALLAAADVPARPARCCSAAAAFWPHGRWAFGRDPRRGRPGHARASGAGSAGLVGEHPRARRDRHAAWRCWSLAAFLPTLKAAGIPQRDIFLTTVESVTGQRGASPGTSRPGPGTPIDRHRPRGQGAGRSSTSSARRPASRPWSR